MSSRMELQLLRINNREFARVVVEKIFFRVFKRELEIGRKKGKQKKGETIGGGSTVNGTGTSESAQRIGASLVFHPRPVKSIVHLRAPPNNSCRKQNR